jgi:hypothetical protein
MEDRSRAEPIAENSCQQERTWDLSIFSTGNRSIGQSVVFIVYFFSFHYRMLSNCEFSLIWNLLFTLRTRGGELLL